MIEQLVSFIRSHKQGCRMAFFGTVMAIVIWSMTLDTQHAHTWFEKHIPAFWSVFAFLAALFLIFFARWFGRGGIQTREDYYGD